MSFRNHDFVGFRAEQLKVFCQRVASTKQTPELISLVAADSDYISYCRKITNANDKYREQFTAFLQENGFDPDEIRIRVSLVATVIGVYKQADYYGILGVTPDADKAAIKKAYRNRAQMVHPDKCIDEETACDEFIELQAAYEHLSDPELRKKYDAVSVAAGSWSEGRRGGIYRARKSPAGRFVSWMCILMGGGVVFAYAYDFVQNQHSSQIVSKQSYEVPVEEAGSSDAPAKEKTVTLAQAPTQKDEKGDESVQIQEQVSDAAQQDDSNSPDIKGEEDGISEDNSNLPYWVTGAANSDAINNPADSSSPVEDIPSVPETSDMDPAGESGDSGDSVADQQPAPAELAKGDEIAATESTGANQKSDGVSQEKPAMVPVVAMVKEAGAEKEKPAPSIVPEASNTEQKNLQKKDGVVQDKPAAVPPVAMVQKADIEKKKPAPPAVKKVPVASETPDKDLKPDRDTKKNKGGSADKAAKTQIVAEEQAKKTPVNPDKNKNKKRQKPDGAVKDKPAPAPVVAMVQKTDETKENEAPQKVPEVSKTLQAIPEPKDMPAVPGKETVALLKLAKVPAPQPVPVETVGEEGEGRDGSGVQKQRVMSFLNDFTKTYEARNLKRFKQFFTDNALEQGKPFKTMLPKYQKTFERIKKLQYDINLTSVSSEDGKDTILVQGNFTTRYQIIHKKWESSTGSIRLKLLDSPGGLLVARMDYEFGGSN